MCPHVPLLIQVVLEQGTFTLVLAVLPKVPMPCWLCKLGRLGVEGLMGLKFEWSTQKNYLNTQLFTKILVICPPAGDKVQKHQIISKAF